MLTSIWKYPFDIDDHIVIEMPVGAIIRHVECQAGTPTIWAEVRRDAKKIQRRFRLVETGHPFNTDHLTFIATFQQPPFVWHLYEES